MGKLVIGRKRQDYATRPSGSLVFIAIGILYIGYNIASRATQSNSVSVSVLKIPIVHYEGVSKSLRQKFYFRLSSHCQRGENIIFRYNNGYKHAQKETRPTSPKTKTIFRPFLMGLKFLNEAEKEKNSGKRRLGISAVTTRFTVRGWQKDTLVKPDKLQIGLFQPFKVSLNFSVLKLFSI